MPVFAGRVDECYSATARRYITYIYTYNGTIDHTTTTGESFRSSFVGTLKNFIHHQPTRRNRSSLLLLLPHQTRDSLNIFSGHSVKEQHVENSKHGSYTVEPSRIGCITAGSITKSTKVEIRQDHDTTQTYPKTWSMLNSWTYPLPFRCW